MVAPERKLSLILATLGLFWAMVVCYLAFKQNPKNAFGGARYLTVFSQLAKHEKYKADPIGKLPTTFRGYAIDNTPVATIRSKPLPSGHLSDMHGANNRSRKPPAEKPKFHRYKILAIFGERVMLQDKNRITMLKPGDDLGTAGKILSIKRKQKKWIIITSKGYISQ